MDRTDPNEPVAILTLSEPTRAEFFKSQLENEGIDSWIEGEHQAALTGALKIRLFVRAADEDRARSFLQEHHQLP